MSRLTKTKSWLEIIDGGLKNKFALTPENYGQQLQELKKDWQDASNSRCVSCYIMHRWSQLVNRVSNDQKNFEYQARNDKILKTWTELAGEPWDPEKGTQAVRQALLNQTRRIHEWAVHMSQTLSKPVCDICKGDSFEKVAEDFYKVAQPILEKQVRPCGDRVKTIQQCVDFLQALHQKRGGSKTTDSLGKEPPRNTREPTTQQQQKNQNAVRCDSKASIQSNTETKSEPPWISFGSGSKSGDSEQLNTLKDKEAIATHANPESAETENEVHHHINTPKISQESKKVTIKSSVSRKADHVTEKKDSPTKDGKTTKTDTDGLESKDSSYGRPAVKSKKTEDSNEDPLPKINNQPPPNDKERPRPAVKQLSGINSTPSDSCSPVSMESELTDLPTDLSTLSTSSNSRAEDVGSNISGIVDDVEGSFRKHTKVTKDLENEMAASNETNNTRQEPQDPMDKTTPTAGEKEPAKGVLESHKLGNNELLTDKVNRTMMDSLKAEDSVGIGESAMERKPTVTVLEDCKVGFDEAVELSDSDISETVDG